MFLSDEGLMLETLDYTIRIGSTPTFLYFDLYTYLYLYMHKCITCAIFIKPRLRCGEYFMKTL